MGVDICLQQKIADFLPVALQQLIKSCEVFLSNFQGHSDEEQFINDHKAFKLALSNIEILMKLAKYGEQPEAESNAQLETLLDQALLQAQKNQDAFSKT